MLLRKTQIQDLDRVMEILADGRASIAALGIDQWQGGYPHRDAIEQDIALGESYVLEDGEGALHASAMISFRGEADYGHIEEGEWLSPAASDHISYAVVHRVAVARESKGRGFASLVLREAETLALLAGSCSVRIDTHPGNAPMLGLLKKEGYTRCGTIYITHAEGSNPKRIAFEKLIIGAEGFEKAV